MFVYLNQFSLTSFLAEGLHRSEIEHCLQSTWYLASLKSVTVSLRKLFHQLSCLKVSHLQSCPVLAKKEFQCLKFDRTFLLFLFFSTLFKLFSNKYSTLTITKQVERKVQSVKSEKGSWFSKGWALQAELAVFMYSSLSIYFTLVTEIWIEIRSFCCIRIKMWNPEFCRNWASKFVVRLCNCKWKLSFPTYSAQILQVENGLKLEAANWNSPQIGLTETDGRKWSERTDKIRWQGCSFHRKGKCFLYTYLFKKLNYIDTNGNPLYCTCNYSILKQ